MKKLTLAVLLLVIGITSVSSQSRSILDENLDTLKLEGLTFLSGNLSYQSATSEFSGGADYGFDIRIGKYIGTEMALYGTLGYFSQDRGLVFFPTGQGIATRTSSLRFGAGTEHYTTIAGNLYFTAAFQVIGAFNKFPDATGPPSTYSNLSINVAILPGFRYQISRHFAVNLISSGFRYNQYFGENSPQPASTTTLRLGLSSLRFGMDYLF